ncbi:histone-like nucleoid-structuring protein Lsr2 [Streptomyces sp. NPDC059459]|uniref:Lsr2 dimerization domain-containing protein n=1 Tax=Streptomyces sp. NPDC059459 TaxID=3346839 RepID=UPI0036BC58EA
MAQKIVAVCTDDLTGKESAEVRTHTFSLGGVNYEIDLTSDPSAPWTPPSSS